jgi:ABC-type transporter Mla subunit MlaD
MYGALWRILPGPVWLRILEVLVLVAIVLVVLVLWVFPWVQELIPTPDVTVDRQ